MRARSARSKSSIPSAIRLLCRKSNSAVYRCKWTSRRGSSSRLARSTRDLLNTLAAVTAKEAGFRSLADAWADTTTAHGRLMLTVLGGLAEFERELIRARTGEGRARAKARGQSLGRPFKLTPHQRSEAIGQLGSHPRQTLKWPPIRGRVGLFQPIDRYVPAVDPVGAR
jgi:resolvase-like protein